MRPFLALLLCCALAPAASARELWRGGEWSLGWSGSLRQIAVAGSGTDAEDFARVFQDAALAGLADALAGAAPLPCASAAGLPSCPAFGEVGDRDVWSYVGRLRNRFELRGEALSAVVEYDHQLRVGILDTFENQLGQGVGTELWLDLEDVIHESDHSEWIHRLYRIFARYETRRAELTIGRQRVAWGVGRLWNPIDRLNAIPPLAIQADESLGVDAIDLRWRFSGFSYLEAVYAPGADRDASAAALRWHGVWHDVDLSLMGGVFQEAATVGLDVASNVGDFAMRLEAVYTDPERDVWRIGWSRPREVSPYWQVVVSADRLFEIGTGLYALVEHLYNGNALGFGSGRAGPLLAFFEATAQPPIPGLPASLGPFVRPASRDVFGTSRVVSGARHQTGFQLSYEFNPALAADSILLVDWNGPSGAWFPSLRYTGFANLEFSLGFQLFAGGDRSEFGSAEPFVFTLVDFYF